MIKIGFSGLPSTGKTTLTQAVNLALKQSTDLNRVELVSEYARSYIRKYGGIENIWEQYRLVDIQQEWETLADKSKIDVMLADSPIQLAFLYATELNGGTAKEQMVMSDIFKKISKITADSPYDIIFHLPEDGIPVLLDDVRHECIKDKKWRTQADAFTRSLFKMFKPCTFEVVEQTTLDERVDWVVQKIREYVLNKELINPFHEI
jgi:nicotinamide riboside kinase